MSTDHFIPELEETEELHEHYRIIVDNGQQPERIDKFLMLRIAGATRNRIQNGILAESVLVNNKPTKNSYKVKPSDVVTVVLAEPPRNTELIPENIPLNIIYEDDTLLIVNKVAGMVVHPAYANYTGTLVNALVYHFEQLPNMQGDVPRPGLVHRIDKDTSGLLLIAKTEFAMSHLAKQFYDHTTHRRYVAVVWGRLPEEGTISGYIGRSVKDRKVMSLYTDEQKGKWSVTHYKVLQQWDNMCLVECRLETGRTHQIRCHLSHIGHPIFADEVYGGCDIRSGNATGAFKKFIQNTIELCPRQALHAKEIGFIHPKTKEYMQFEIDIPTDMQAAIERFATQSKFN